jgi:hypothetical protein
MILDYLRDRIQEKSGWQPDLILMNTGLNDIKRASNLASPTCISLED